MRFVWIQALHLNLEQGNCRGTIHAAIIFSPRIMSQLILKRLEYYVSVYSNYARQSLSKM